MITRPHVKIVAHIATKSKIQSSHPMCSRFIARAMKFEAEEEPRGELLKSFPDLHKLWKEHVETLKDMYENTEEGVRVYMKMLSVIFDLDEESESASSKSLTEAPVAVNPEDNYIVLRRIRDDIHRSPDPLTYSNLLQGKNPLTTIEYRIDQRTNILEHMEGACNAGLVDRNVLLHRTGDTWEKIREDSIDFIRFKWEQWERSVHGLDDLSRRRSFRRWNAIPATREEFREWRDGRDCDV